MTEHPAHEALRAYASRLEDEVSPGVTHRGVRKAMAAEPARLRLKRTAVVVASALGFGLGNTALALAAQPSVPGDVLYGVERAYERVAALVGIQLGSPEERLDEAKVLIERGDLMAARALVVEALGDAGVPGASELAQQVPPENVGDLVDRARGVADAAKTGDPDQVADAVAEMRDTLGPPDVPPGQGGAPPGQAKQDEGGSVSETAPGNPGGGASGGSKGKGSGKKP